MLESWPKAFYLEASILRKLPLDVMNAEMQRLQGWSKALGASINIPEVSWREWSRDRRKLVESHIDGAERRVRELDALYTDKVKIHWSEDRDTVIRDLPAVTRGVLDDVGIQVIPTPQLDLNMLVDMSVRHAGPFEKEDKGFRDAVNLLTVLEFAKSTGESHHLLLAEDNVYAPERNKQIVERYEVRLVVCRSIAECISLLENFSELVRERTLIYQKAVLREFLRKRKAEIEEFIRRNAEFNVSWWGWGLKLGAGVGGTVEEITDVKAQDVVSVTRGTLPNGSGAGRVKISFVVRVNLDLLVKPFVLPPPEKLRLGEASTASSFFGASVKYKPPSVESRTVPADIRLDATVILETEKQEKGPPKERYSDLKLESVAT